MISLQLTTASHFISHIHIFAANGTANVAAAHELWKDLINMMKSAEEISTTDVLRAIQDRARNWIHATREKNSAAALWLQSMEMMDGLRKFIRAERTANWELHLQAVCEMPPYLTALGHNMYAKYVWLYVQSMNE